MFRNTLDSKLILFQSDCSNPEDDEEKENANSGKVHPCDFPGCDKVYRKKWHLKDHKRAHTGEKPFECTWEGCNMKFAQSGTLTTHYRKHTGEKPFKCNLCDKSFAQSGTLAK